MKRPSSRGTDLYDGSPLPRCVRPRDSLSRGLLDTPEFRLPRPGETLDCQRGVYRRSARVNMGLPHRVGLDGWEETVSVECRISPRLTTGRGWL